MICPHLYIEDLSSNNAVCILRICPQTTQDAGTYTVQHVTTTYSTSVWLPLRYGTPRYSTDTVQHVTTTHNTSVWLPLRYETPRYSTDTGTYKTLHCSPHRYNTVHWYVTNSTLFNTLSHWSRPTRSQLATGQNRLLPLWSPAWRT